jgi:hypothetical protein
VSGPSDTVEDVTGPEGTVLAALITGAVVAITFLAAEITRSKREANIARASAIADLLRKLDDVPLSAAMKRRYLKKYYPMPPDFELMSSAMRLLPLLPKKDRNLVLWLTGKLDGMLELSALERTRRGAQMTSMLVLYLTDRRLARRKLASDGEAVSQWLEALSSSADAAR